MIDEKKISICSEDDRNINNNETIISLKRDSVIPAILPPWEDDNSNTIKKSTFC